MTLNWFSDFSYYKLGIPMKEISWKIIIIAAKDAFLELLAVDLKGMP
jgi:hypothetical protein